MIREIENRIKVYIDKHQLIQKGDRIVVGVSGGADSMMLLHYLYQHQHEYGISIVAAHIHHGVREEAEEDANYVKEICKEWSIPFHIHYCKVKEIAVKKGITEEEAGRLERYNFFISLTNPGDKIATAHNRNDQAETMIMRFLRGTDIKGLAGIPAKRENIIRPLLDLEREKIEYYCRNYHIKFKEDHTNFMPIYSRNKVRLVCLPYVQENFNSNIVGTLAEHSELYREEEEFLESYIQKIFPHAVDVQENQLTISVGKLLEEKSYIQKKLLLYCIGLLGGHTKDITLTHVKSILGLATKQTGKRVSLPYNLTALRQYDNIVILKHYKEVSAEYDYILQLGSNLMEEKNVSIELITELPKTFEQTTQNMYTKYIDYDKIKDSLHLRTRREKDFITLHTGSKKLKKFFIDQKIPADKRSTLPLITDGNEVVWIIGNRLNTKYYVTNETTRVLKIKVTTN